MDSDTHTGVPEPRFDGRRPEPRLITLADLGVIVAGVALVMVIPPRASAWSPFLPPPSMLFAVVILGLRLTVGFGLVLALVLLFRCGRYGGRVRPAEWLALGLASLSVLDAVPNLDDAVNAYYAAVGSNALDFGVARWLLSAPAAAGVVLVVAGLVLLRRRVRDGSRVAAALSVIGILGGLFLWFWGPCEVARLELPWLLVRGPQGDPSSWGWRTPVVFALRDVVANGPTALTWGIPAAAAARAWWEDRRRGRARARVWTERAAFACAVVAALMLAVVGPHGPDDLVWRVTWVIGVGLMSWWIIGRLGVCASPRRPHRRLPVEGLGPLAVEEDPIGRRGGGGRRGLPREARFLGPLTAAKPEACALRRAHGDAEEPVAQQVGLAQRPGLVGQDEEDGLEGVLGQVLVAEDLPADAQNHWSVAGDERGEGGLAGLIATGREPLDQLAVGEPGRRTALEERPEITAQRCHRHVRPSRSRRRSRAGRIWPTLAACYPPPNSSHPLGTMLSGRPSCYPRQSQKIWTRLPNLARPGDASVRRLLNRDVAEVDRLARLDVVVGRRPPAGPTEIPSLQEVNTQKPILARVDPTEARKALATPDQWISIGDAVAEQPSDPRQSIAGADRHRTRAA